MPFVEASENHFAGGRLVDRSHQDVYRLINEAASAVHDDHGAILEVRDALIHLFAFAQDEDSHAFAGQNGGAESVGEKIDVENSDALNAGDLIEIEIVGDDFGLKTQSQFD